MAKHAPWLLPSLLSATLWSVAGPAAMAAPLAPPAPAIVAHASANAEAGPADEAPEAREHRGMKSGKACDCQGKKGGMKQGCACGDQKHGEMAMGGHYGSKGMKHGERAMGEHPDMQCKQHGEMAMGGPGMKGMKQGCDCGDMQHGMKGMKQGCDCGDMKHGKMGMKQGCDCGDMKHGKMGMGRGHGMMGMMMRRVLFEPEIRYMPAVTKNQYLVLAGGPRMPLNAFASVGFQHNMALQLGSTDVNAGSWIADYCGVVPRLGFAAGNFRANIGALIGGGAMGRTVQLTSQTPQVNDVLQFRLLYAVEPRVELGFMRKNWGVSLVGTYLVSQYQQDLGGPSVGVKFTFRGPRKKHHAEHAEGHGGW